MILSAHDGDVVEHILRATADVAEENVDECRSDGWVVLGYTRMVVCSSDAAVDKVGMALPIVYRWDELRRGCIFEVMFGGVDYVRPAGEKEAKRVSKN